MIANACWCFPSWTPATDAARTAMPSMPISMVQVRVVAGDVAVDGEAHPDHPERKEEEDEQPDVGQGRPAMQ
ncbi:hypothetical protein ABZ654_11280 [Streptomyces hygroscopicus]|uniref:hypothetical protein n=1 Tax=Streptomyces hygroscopicus TaxID=1912 RepID=UPI0033EC8C86